MLKPGISLFLFFISFSAMAESAAPHSTTARTGSSIIGITQRNNIRVVYDVSANETEIGVGRALFYVRGLLEAYKAQGVPASKLKINMVIHGAAASWLLNEENYRKRQLDPFDINPNEIIISELISQGVNIEICHATMREKGWTERDLLPGIRIVHDAYTRLIDLQINQHYAYLHF